MYHILVVDEDRMVRGITMRILAAEGYTVDEASNLTSARAMAVQTDFTLVVADTNLSDGGGVRMIEMIKQIRPQTEIIVLTSEGNLDLAICCMRAGAVDFLMKPCAGQQLREAVRKAIERKELSKENIMLRALNEMKDKFLTLVSHELRTPLTLIYGYLTILQRQSASFELDQVDLLNIIQKSTKQLIDIVNNIQIIAQAESGEIKLHLQSILPRKIMADVLGEMKATPNQRKLLIHLEDGEEIDPINGDSIRLRQAILELIQNAVRNTPDGGEIVVGARRENAAAVFWVKDNGVGIPESEHGKIFEPFYEVADVKQHSSSASRFKGGGIGIGLALVKAVVEAHRGSIRLHSAPGQGTLVELLLPMDLTLPASSLASPSN